MRLLLEFLELCCELLDQVLHLLHLLGVGHLIRVLRKQLLQLNDALFILLVLHCELRVVLLHIVQLLFVLLVVPELNRLLLEALDLVAELSGVLLVVVALLLELLLVLRDLLLFELDLGLHLTLLEQALEVVRTLLEVLVLLEHHVLVELELLDLVRQFRVDVLLVLVLALQLLVTLLKLQEAGALYVVAARVPSLAAT